MMSFLHTMVECAIVDMYTDAQSAGPVGVGTDDGSLRHCVMTVLLFVAQIRAQNGQPALLRSPSGTCGAPAAAQPPICIPIHSSRDQSRLVRHARACANPRQRRISMPYRAQPTTTLHKLHALLNTVWLEPTCMRCCVAASSIEYV